MSRSAIPVLCALGALAWNVAGAQPPEGAFADEDEARKNFVACPIVRNTYVPCWLAEHDGELYYLGPQGDLGAEFYPPQLGHKALIEGVVAEEQERICGGIVLEPVNVSVLPELSPSCNTILPAQGHSSPPHHRTPGPSNSAEEERESTERALPDSPPPEGVTFDVPFEFDVGERMYNRDTRAVRTAARYALEVGAERVQVIGYRGGALLSSGELFREKESVGELRARNVRRMLVHAGLDEEVLEMDWRAAEAPDGIDDHRLRRATIVVMP